MTGQDTPILGGVVVEDQGVVGVGVEECQQVVGRDEPPTAAVECRAQHECRDQPRLVVVNFGGLGVQREAALEYLPVFGQPAVERIRRFSEPQGEDRVKCG